MSWDTVVGWYKELSDIDRTKPKFYYRTSNRERDNGKVVVMAKSYVQSSASNKKLLVFKPNMGKVIETKDFLNRSWRKVRSKSQMTLAGKLWTRQYVIFLCTSFAHACLLCISAHLLSVSLPTCVCVLCVFRYDRANTSCYHKQIDRHCQQGRACTQGKRNQVYHLLTGRILVYFDEISQAQQSYYKSHPSATAKGKAELLIESDDEEEPHPVSEGRPQRSKSVDQVHVKQLENKFTVPRDCLIYLLAQTIFNFSYCLSLPTPLSTSCLCAGVSQELFAARASPAVQGRPRPQDLCSQPDSQRRRGKHRYICQPFMFASAFQCLYLL